MTNQGKSKKELLAASKDMSPVWGTVDLQVPIDDYDLSLVKTPSEPPTDVPTPQRKQVTRWHESLVSSVHASPN